MSHQASLNAGIMAAFVLFELMATLSAYWVAKKKGVKLFNKMGGPVEAALVGVCFFVLSPIVFLNLTFPDQPGYGDDRDVL